MHQPFARTARLGMPVAAGGDPFVTPQGLFLGDGTPLIMVELSKEGASRTKIRPEIEIALLLDAAYGDCPDVTRVMKGLEAVARAFAARDLARAGIAGAHLGLPPIDAAIAVDRLGQAKRLLKGDYDPNEPRDERGRWTTGSGVSTAGTGSINAVRSFLDWINPIATAHAAGAEEEEGRSLFEELQDAVAAERFAEFVAACAKLRAIEPGNLELTGWENQNHVPTESDIEAVQGAYREALERRGAETTSIFTRDDPLTQYYVTGSGGRWGGNPVRTLNDEIATMLKNQGYEVTDGAGRESEEWLPSETGGTKGSTYVDITAVKGTVTIRVQTITTLADGRTPTPREAAARIRAKYPDDMLLLIPKR